MTNAICTCNATLDYGPTAHVGVPASYLPRLRAGCMIHGERCNITGCKGEAVGTVETSTGLVRLLVCEACRRFLVKAGWERL